METEAALTLQFPGMERVRAWSQLHLRILGAGPGVSGVGLQGGGAAAGYHRVNSALRHPAVCEGEEEWLTTAMACYWIAA